MQFKLFDLPASWPMIPHFHQQRSGLAFGSVVIINKRQTDPSANKRVLSKQRTVSFQRDVDMRRRWVRWDRVAEQVLYGTGRDETRRDETRRDGMGWDGTDLDEIRRDELKHHKTRLESNKNKNVVRRDEMYQKSNENETKTTTTTRTNKKQKKKTQENRTSSSPPHSVL